MGDVTPAKPTGNSTPRKHGMGFHLHKQWTATSTGKELHMAAVAKEKERPVHALDRKGGKRVQ